MTSGDKGNIRYPIPASSLTDPHMSETVIRRSRFVAQTCNVSNRQQAMEFVNHIRNLHPGATHNCWAYAAGAPGDTACIGCSDDGEPKGTAGKPMLQVLLHSGIGQICTVVSRWFGGVKLGTGGLVRAYQDSVAQNIDTLPTNEAILMTRWQIIAEYATLNTILHKLAALGITIEAQEFGATASLTLRVPEDRHNLLAEYVGNASNGTAQLIALD